MPQLVQLQVFEELWGIVKNNYLYPDFNGLDWNSVYDEYRQRIQAGMSGDDFYIALGEMIHRLGDEHSNFFNPLEAIKIDEETGGRYDYAGIGVYTIAIPEHNLVSILLTFPGSPAELAGLKPHDNILAVDGIPILDEKGFRRDLLRGPEGTSIELTIQSPGEAPRQVRIPRQRINTSMPVPHQVLTTPNGKKIGYIFIPTFQDNTIDNQIQDAILNLNANEQLDGLILDNRFNAGGISTVLENTLSFFTNGQLGYFIRRNQRSPMTVDGQDVAGSQQVPLVVLISDYTASFGEIFSGILQDTGRAYLLGEQTEGNVEVLHVYNLQDGSRAWIAEETFEPLNHPEQNWEQSGIIPDLVVNSNWDEVIQSTDPAIVAALAFFDR